MSSEREDRCRFGNRFLCSMLLVRLLVHIASINAWHRLKVATRRLSWGGGKLPTDGGAKD